MAERSHVVGYEKEDPLSSVDSAPTDPPASATEGGKKDQVEHFEEDEHESRRSSKWSAARDKIANARTIGLAMFQRTENRSGPSPFDHLYTNSSYVITPDATFRKTWDCMQALILCFTAIIVPFRVGFNYFSTGALYWIELLVDLYFWIDIVLNFVTAYENQEDHGRLVTYVPAIAYNYLCTWFLPDLAGCLPIDLMYRIQEKKFTCSLTSSGCQNVSSPSSSQLFKMFKLLRMFRMMKLLRLFRISRLLARYQDDLFELLPIIDMMKLLSVLFFLGHFMGCFFYFFASLDTFRLEHEKDVDSWVDSLEGQPVLTKYVASMYWAFTTMTTVGYGDISAVTIAERVVAIASMICGGFIFSCLIGSMTGVLQSFKISQSVFNETMDKVSCLVKDKCLPKPLRNKILNHIRMQEMPYYNMSKIVALLPASIRWEVIEVVFGTDILQSTIFRGCREEFIESLLVYSLPRHFREKLVLSYPNNEATGLLLVKSGTLLEVDQEGTVIYSYTAGNTANSFLLDKVNDAHYPGLNPNTMVCDTIVAIYEIPAEALRYACIMYPEDHKKMVDNNKDAMKQIGLVGWRRKQMMEGGDPDESSNGPSLDRMKSCKVHPEATEEYLKVEDIDRPSNDTPGPPETNGDGDEPVVVDHQQIMMEDVESPNKWMKPPRDTSLSPDNIFQEEVITSGPPTYSHNHINNNDNFHNRGAAQIMEAQNAVITKLAQQVTDLQSQIKRMDKEMKNRDRNMLRLIQLATSRQFKEGYV
mmetsp:Transcript_34427/g.41595  ORF Transcript_34427/g.41595 Transcript_34427/m.41595 type:complete len:757 (-) Transcript_34427:134-2404(-)|eukprot:CAMPEP_0197846330 /NCGR_PEP_ID=MMETSP1438-20131217/3086_1 /TAXON_ID=1461541 /ORGANISM="Pterosperma sp., Strain CCMP1384" /LENGTH=756 /DNA_ID=CAMNT_0043457931 /DNA_START=492 /DNA_END=2762 /DNA_ORIENTATION=+